MSDLFLTDREALKALTGKHRLKDQVSWLRANGIRFETNRRGPVVFMADGKPQKLAYQDPPPGLVHPEEIIRLATPVKPVCGIYFLICASRIMYVGQSRRIFDRITEHVRKKAFAFDAFYFIEVPRHRLSAVEAAYIKAFRPPANIVGRTSFG